MSIPRFNTFTAYAYVVNVTELKDKGGYKYVQGRLKIPMWGNYEDIYLNFSATQEDAIRLSKVLRKGIGGFFDGKLVTKNFLGTDKKMKYITEFKVEEFRIVDLKKDAPIPYHNKFIGLCNLVTDAKLREKDKKTYVSMRVAVNLKNNKDVLYTQAYYLGTHAQQIYKYLKKGTGVLISGHLMSLQKINFLQLNDLQIVHNKF